LVPPPFPEVSWGWPWVVENRPPTWWGVIFKDDYSNECDKSVACINEKVYHAAEGKDVTLARAYCWMIGNDASDTPLKRCERSQMEWSDRLPSRLTSRWVRKIMKIPRVLRLRPKDSIRIAVFERARCVSINMLWWWR